MPVGFNKRLPPAHLVATRPSGETWFIRIQKIAHCPATVLTVETNCGKDLVQFRKHLSRNPGVTGLHCEIWIYTLCHGFRCFEVLTDSIREIPKLTLVTPNVRKMKGVA
jgi:hypothetical protein